MGRDNADDLKAAVQQMANATPVMRVGRTMSALGGMVRDTATAVAKRRPDLSKNLGKYLHKPKGR